MLPMFAQKKRRQFCPIVVSGVCETLYGDIFPSGCRVGTAVAVNLIRPATSSNASETKLDSLLINHRYCMT
jgi:hypothetical protein